jgi:hypothetical protein
MVKIILIGRCCRVSNDIIDINLKSETSLFEWTANNTLNEVNIIIQKLVNKEPIEIYRFNGNDYMKDTEIMTSHYINTNYEEIVARRSKRFIDDIVGNKEILFIRDDAINNIRYEEVDKFFSLVKSINPDLNFKLLLLSDIEINYPGVCQKKYNKSLYKDYINECFLIQDTSNNKKYLHDLSDED